MSLQDINTVETESVYGVIDEYTLMLRCVYLNYYVFFLFKNVRVCISYCMTHSILHINHILPIYIQRGNLCMIIK